MEAEVEAQDDDVGRSRFRQGPSRAKSTLEAKRKGNKRKQLSEFNRKSKKRSIRCMICQVS